MFSHIRRNLSFFAAKHPLKQRNLRNQRQRTQHFYAKRTQFSPPQADCIPLASKALSQNYNFVESQKRTQTNPIQSQFLLALLVADLSRRGAPKTEKPNFLAFAHLPPARRVSSIEHATLHSLHYLLRSLRNEVQLQNWGPVRYNLACLKAAFRLNYSVWAGLKRTILNMER